MSKSQRCTLARRVSGRLEIHFRNETMDFENVAAIGDFVDSTYDDNESLLRGLLIRWARKNGRWSDAEGKTITLDFNEPNGNIVKVT